VGPVIISDNLRGSEHRWFSTDGFTISSPEGVFGNANQRFFHGPGFNNWDIGIHKDTQIHERFRVQFRAELFNAFNHAQFFPSPASGFLDLTDYLINGIPDNGTMGVLGSDAEGNVEGFAVSRRLTLGARIRF
jgi:hypothetical protein